MLLVVLNLDCSFNSLYIAVFLESFKAVLITSSIAYFILVLLLQFSFFCLILVFCCYLFPIPFSQFSCSFVNQFQLLSLFSYTLFFCHIYYSSFSHSCLIFCSFSFYQFNSNFWFTFLVFLLNFVVQFHLLFISYILTASRWFDRQL